MKVYVADDYANFRKLLVDILQHDGHDVAAADDGSALLAMIVEDAPDVVVADLRLSGMSAIDLLIEMREARLLVPVVVMTSDSPEDVALTVAGFGGVRVLQKPFKLEALQRALGELAKA